MADQVCQPGATWQPFIIKATFKPLAPPNVVAVSNFTWCATRQQQLTAATIISNGVHLKSNTKLFKVKSSAGTQLLLLNPETEASPGGTYQYLKTQGKLFLYYWHMLF
jgi:hypothetical protein